MPLAFTGAHPSWAEVHKQFTDALPGMQNAIHLHIRHLPRRLRDEALQDAIAACWLAWHGLVRRGKDPLQVGPTGIARFAAVG